MTRLLVRLPLRLVPLVLLIGLCGCLSMDLRSLLAPELKEVVVADDGGRAKIALVSIQGFIGRDSSSPFDLVSDATPTDLKAVLNRIERDRDIRAVVLKIDSPGGEVTASDMMYHEILSFKQRTGLPVFASICSMGCSGAYYIACAADQIYVHPTSIVGSIGVIARFPQIKKLADKIGYDQVVIKSGKMKAMGDPFKEMAPEEQAIIQQAVDQMYGRFVQVVANGRRDLNETDVRAIADGRIYTPMQAEKLGLVDGIAYLDGVLAKARTIVGLERARVIQYTYDDHPDINIYSGESRPPLPQVNVSVVDLEADAFLGKSGFFYLWTPTQ